nr:hypothetical protein [uncultured Ruminococcus sp.]
MIVFVSPLTMRLICGAEIPILLASSFCEMRCPLHRSAIHDGLNAIRWKKQRERYKSDHDSELRQFYAVRRVLIEELGDQPINVKAWQREYDALLAEYAGLRAQYNPLKEELAKLRMVCYQVDRVINEREQKKQPQQKRATISL